MTGISAPSSLLELDQDDAGLEGFSFFFNLDLTDWKSSSLSALTLVVDFFISEAGLPRGFVLTGVTVEMVILVGVVQDTLARLVLRNWVETFFFTSTSGASSSESSKLEICFPTNPEDGANFFLSPHLMVIFLPDPVAVSTCVNLSVVMMLPTLPGVDLCRVFTLSLNPIKEL